MDKCKHQIPWDECNTCAPAFFHHYPGWVNINSSTGGSSEYYDLPPHCKTLQDVIEGYEKVFGVKMEWSQANVFKAAYRWAAKPNLRYNLNKGKWFCNDRLERLDEEERIEK